MATASATAAATSSGAASATPTPSPSPSRAAKTDAKPKRKPDKRAVAVVRGAVTVSVYNNTRITGWAGRTAAQVRADGWRLGAVDNWRGQIPATTVYYPASLRAAAQLLARDLGISRLMPAVSPMGNDRLTVILSGS